MNKEQFKILFDKYFDKVRTHIYYRSGDTEMSTDIAQETFMRIWEKRIYPEFGKELALLFTIATNILISRKRREQTAMNFRQSLKLQIENHSPEDHMEYQDTKVKYEQALMALGEKQRVVFLMSRIDNMSYHDIAEKLEIGVKAVEKRMSQALASLRKALL